MIKAANGAISVTADGDIILHHATSLTIAPIDESHSFSTSIEDVMPGSATVDEEGAFALIASRSKNGQDLPIRLSAVPIRRDAWNAQYTDVKLSSAAIRSLLGDFQGKEAVLVNAALRVFTILSCKSEDDVSIRVALPGAQVTLAPLHNLVASGADTPISLALLSTSASASVEVIEGANPLVLLTPPPSPPPLGRSAAFMFSTSSATTPSPTIVPQPDECIRAVSKDVPAAYVPLTPTSPEPRKDKEFFTGEDLASASLIPRHSTSLARGSFLRFIVTFMAWLLQVSLAKMFAIFGGNILFWLTYGLFGTGSRLDEVAQGQSDPFISNTAEDSDAEELDESADEKASDAGTLLGLDDVTDQAMHDGPDVASGEKGDQDHIETATISDITSSPDAWADPQIIETPKARTSTAVEPPQPLRKDRARFVADVRSDVVSLLIRTSSKHAILPELNVTTNGERVSASAQSSETIQLADDTHLLELRLPAARLEVSLA